MELKPCPLCDSVNCQTCSPDTESNQHMIECLNCGLETGAYASKEKAKEVWNYRPREEELFEALFLDFFNALYNAEEVKEKVLEKYITEKDEKNN